MPRMAGRRRPLPFLDRNRYPGGRLAGGGLKTQRWYWRGNLSPAQRTPPRLDAHPAVPSLADPHVAPRRHHVPALRFQLEKAIVVPHHPIVTDGACTLQSKDPIQFRRARCLAVIILRPRCAPPETLVANTPAPHTRWLLRDCGSPSVLVFLPSGPGVYRAGVPHVPWLAGNSRLSA